MALFMPTNIAATGFVNSSMVSTGALRHTKTDALCCVTLSTSVHHWVIVSL